MGDAQLGAFRDERPRFAVLERDISLMHVVPLWLDLEPDGALRQLSARVRDVARRIVVERAGVPQSPFSLLEASYLFRAARVLEHEVGGDIVEPPTRQRQASSYKMCLQHAGLESSHVAELRELARRLSSWVCGFAVASVEVDWHIATIERAVPVDVATRKDWHPHDEPPGACE